MHRFYLAMASLAVAALLLPWGARAAEPSTAVTVVSLAEVRVHPVRSAPATVVSLNDSRISAEIGGTVEAITVRPGDTVQPGALLVRLDCRDHEIAVQQPKALLQAARASKELADFRYDRAEKLRERGAVSLAQLKERKAAALTAAAEVRRLQALVTQSERAIAKCEIRAPFQAVVVERYASVGELVAVGTPLLRLVDEALLEVSGNIQEQDLASLRVARRVELVSHGERYPLRLRGIVPVLDGRVRSYEVRFALTADKPAPGESGRVDWQAAQPHIPASFLVRREDSFGVFVAADGQARFVSVAGAQAGQPAATELSGDALLVMDGRYGLRDGQPITIVPAAIKTVHK